MYQEIQMHFSPCSSQQQTPTEDQASDKGV